MKEAFIKLHVSIILAGATGIFGKLITLNEGLLVWYRMMFATLLFSIILYFKKELHKIALKAPNVSIGVVCFSLTGFFTAFLEPLIYRRRISIREILFSLLTLFGIILIFHFDTRYRLGICLGAISSALAALFTITNKKIGRILTGLTTTLVSNHT